jgi:hypothetical protein
MAKPNYRQQKKQKEALRKTRQAERLQRRISKPADATAPESAPQAGAPKLLET